MITLGNKLLQTDADYVKNTLWPVILLDLGYVATNWMNTGFDLWEEVSEPLYYPSKRLIDLLVA
jgi:glucoamylase